MDKPKRVLIIDDEVELVEALQLRLEANGYRVLKAYDGNKGLAMARREAPDLIILDVMMPHLDGYHVCRLLKFDARLRGIPIIILTARGQDQDRITGTDVGADHYVVKPFDAAELLAMIGKMIDKS